MGPDAPVVVDCEVGRALGCETFCCRLVVRLEPGERDPGRPGVAGKSCVDKTPDGRCACMEPETQRCAVWAVRPHLCARYDCNQDPLLQVVLKDGYRSLTELVHSPPVPEREHMKIPAMEGEGVAPGEGKGPAHELVRLRRRLEAAPAPERCSEVDVACAQEMRRLHVQIVQKLGSAEACASCARGEPSPVGHFDGGKCCCHPVSVLYDDTTLAALAAAGTTPRDLRGPYQAEGGCIFRGPAGCVIAPEHRPNACVGYLCELLEQELDRRGDLDAVRSLCSELEQAASRFLTLRAMRDLASEIEKLL